MFMTALQFTCQIGLARTALAIRACVRARRDRAAGLASPATGRSRPKPTPWATYLTQVVPNGVCTGLDIGLSNFSLSLITLSFYTMCKSTVPLFLLAFAFAWGLEKPSWTLAGVVAIISVGLLLLVYGETAFDPTGFALVMTASALSGLRWTITQVLLQGGGKNGGSGGGHGGDPIEVLLSLMPVMALTVGAVSLVAERLWKTLPGSPYFDSPASLALTACVVAGGAVIAFLMVWVEFTVIALTSALTFMVAGTFKEIVTVLAAVTFLGEAFTAINAAGLAVLIAGVALFNYTKYRKAMAATNAGGGGGGDGGGAVAVPTNSGGESGFGGGGGFDGGAAGSTRGASPRRARDPRKESGDGLASLPGASSSSGAATGEGRPLALHVATALPSMAEDTGALLGGTGGGGSGGNGSSALAPRGSGLAVRAVRGSTDVEAGGGPGPPGLTLQPLPASPLSPSPRRGGGGGSGGGGGGGAGNPFS
jgi:solute carrier family 35, member C2